MDPRKVAAQFAAYVWCVDGQQRSPEEAARFARENWSAFLPVAHDGLGQLLIRVAALDEGETIKVRAKRPINRLRVRRRAMAVAV